MAAPAYDPGLLSLQGDWLYNRPFREGVAGVNDHGVAVVQPGEDLDLRAVISAELHGEVMHCVLRVQHAEKQRVRGQITSSIKGGFLVDVNGVTGFLPASLADLRPVRNPARMLHTGVRCYIIQPNEAKKRNSFFFTSLAPGCAIEAVPPASWTRSMPAFARSRRRST